MIYDLDWLVSGTEEMEVSQLKNAIKYIGRIKEEKC